MGSVSGQTRIATMNLSLSSSEKSSNYRSSLLNSKVLFSPSSSFTRKKKKTTTLFFNLLPWLVFRTQFQIVTGSLPNAAHSSGANSKEYNCLLFAKLALCQNVQVIKTVVLITTKSLRMLIVIRFLVAQATLCLPAA